MKRKYLQEEYIGYRWNNFYYYVPAAEWKRLMKKYPDNSTAITTLLTGYECGVVQIEGVIKTDKPKD